MASLDSEIVENIEAERNKTEKQLASLTLAARNEIEKQLASLTLAAPNAHLREQLTPLSDKDEENFDPERNKMEKQLASLTLAAPNAHLHEQLTPLIGKDEENCDAMDCDQQIDVLSQLPTMVPAIYRYLSELSNEEYEDLLKYTASKKKVHRAKKKEEGAQQAEDYETSAQSQDETPLQREETTLRQPTEEMPLQRDWCESFQLDCITPLLLEPRDSTLNPALGE